MKESVESILKLFDNREIAFIIWVTIVLIFSLSKTSYRKSLFGYLKIFSEFKRDFIIILAWVYSIFIIYILYSFKYWNFSMVKDSIFWLLFNGLVILFNINRTEQNNNYFLEILKDNIKFTVLLEFIVNIYNFSLSGELFFVPVMGLFVLLTGLLSTNPKYKFIENFLTVILSLIGLMLLILTLIQIATSIHVYIKFYTLRLFLLPIILSITFIPFAYLLSVYMNYVKRINYVKSEIN